jgi:transposase InsO family protein
MATASCTMTCWITARPAARTVARLTRLAGIKAQIGYKRRPGSYGGKPSLAVDNTLDRQFDVAAPDRAWVTDITYKDCDRQPPQCANVQHMNEGRRDGMARELAPMTIMLAEPP